MTANNRKKPTFKAPQAALRSSWVDTPFTKPKACGVVKHSLGRHRTAIVKTSLGVMATSAISHSNEY